MNTTARKLVQREPLVPLVEFDDFEGLNRELAEALFARQGFVSNQARAMANAPETGGFYRKFFEDLRTCTGLSEELRLLIRYKVSTLKTCLYCSAHQIKGIARMGGNEEKLRRIHESDTDPMFDERERVALSFVAAMATDASNIPDDLAGRFVEMFNPKERVEITIMAASMVCMNIINDALRIPLEENALEIAGVGVDMSKLRG